MGFGVRVNEGWACMRAKACLGVRVRVDLEVGVLTRLGVAILLRIIEPI